METVSPSLPSKHSKKIKSDFCIQSDQDGFFFGLEFLNWFLKSEDEADTSEVISYFQDGECVFKGQTLLKINLKKEDLEKEDLMSIVSYLSGTYTLVSCWTKRNFDCAIMACPTSDFLFSDWEKSAILKAGALVAQCPSPVRSSIGEVHQAIKKGEKQIVLNYPTKVSKEEIKDMFQLLPPFVEISLQGSFFPSDLEELRAFNIKSVYPICLQGHFPRLQMICSEPMY